MKTHCLLTVVALFLCPVVQGADAPAAQPATEVGDFSSFKTADEFWKHVEKLQVQPDGEPKSRAEALQMATDWLASLQRAAEAFAKAYPQDSRRWSATMLWLRAGAEMRRISGKGSPDADRQKIAEIVNSPDAPAPLKGEAAFMGAMLLTADFDPAKPETFRAFYQAAADFLEKYPEHPLATQIKQIELQVLNDDPTPESDAVLKKFAASSDPRVAEAARGALERRQKMVDLKSKPVDIKFTAIDGHEVDLANLRGKVVLVDFWASWCGPCIAEMPNVVSTYEKLHGKGFEILGISLDDDKDAMQSALKKHQMTWTQYFEGTGWENKFCKAFGVTAIPRTLLIDKKGMLRETGLHGEALGEGVEKLLAE